MDFYVGLAVGIFAGVTGAFCYMFSDVKKEKDKYIGFSSAYAEIMDNKCRNIFNTSNAKIESKRHKGSKSMSRR